MSSFENNNVFPDLDRLATTPMLLPACPGGTLYAGFGTYVRVADGTKAIAGTGSIIQACRGSHVIAQSKCVVIDCGGAQIDAGPQTLVINRSELGEPPLRVEFVKTLSRLHPPSTREYKTFPAKSIVIVMPQCEVKTDDDCYVLAFDNAIIKTGARCRVIAGDHCYVNTIWGCDIQVGNSGSVITTKSRIRVGDRTHVSAWRSSQVTHGEGCKVTLIG